MVSMTDLREPKLARIEASGGACRRASRVTSLPLMNRRSAASRRGGRFFGTFSNLLVELLLESARDCGFCLFEPFLAGLVAELLSLVVTGFADFCRTFFSLWRILLDELVMFNSSKAVKRRRYLLESGC